MTETTEEISTQPEHSQAESVAIGRIFVAAREKQGLSAADVARQLRLGVKQIEALEADDYVSLPGNTFVRGFIRNYARLLQVDADPLLRAFQQHAPSEALAMSTPPRGGEFSIYPSKRWMWYAGAAALMVIAAPLLVYFALSSDGSQPVSAAKRAQPVPRQPVATLPAVVPEQSAQPLVLQPIPQQVAPVAEQPAGAATMPPPAAPQPVAPVSAAPTGSGRIVFKFDQESWTEVRDKDGKKLFSQLNLAGTEQTVQGEPPFTLVVGNAAHVKAVFNGAPVDLTPYINVDVARLSLK